MGADDPELAADLAPVLDALAADIAADADSDRFPVRRTFDVYASHAWASGTSPFADGNNQESSSEAVNAWAGVTLWGRVSGNAGLEAEGAWLHALEAQAARAYWTDFDRADPVYDGAALARPVGPSLPRRPHRHPGVRVASPMHPQARRAGVARR